MLGTPSSFQKDFIRGSREWIYQCCPCSAGRTKDKKLKCWCMSGTVNYSDNTRQSPGKLLLFSSWENWKSFYCLRVMVLVTKLKNINHGYSFNYVVFFSLFLFDFFRATQYFQTSEWKFWNLSRINFVTKQFKSNSNHLLLQGAMDCSGSTGTSELFLLMLVTPFWPCKKTVRDHQVGTTTNFGLN